MFNWFKKKYPVLKPDLIVPVDEPLPTTQAKKMFRKYMLAIGFFDKQDIGFHVELLSEDIKEHEQSLKDEVAEKKGEIKDAKGEIKKLQIELLMCSDEEKEDIEIQIGELKTEIGELQKDLQKYSQELSNFKKDKRLYLVDYINTQIHGPEWRSK